ncbi:hypothetical protein K8I85_17915 [bacterium]|nr:hypothetical protein [bacterium]
MKSRIFTIDERDGVTIVGFHHREKLAGTDQSRIQDLWSLLKAQETRPSKVLVLQAPTTLLTTSSLDAFWAALLANSEAMPLGHSAEPADSARLYLAREENAFCEFIQRIRRIDAFVIAVLQGEIDLPFLGLALACDYRIVADDTVFVSRCLDLGLPPVGALPWFLARFLGHGKASEILLRSGPISAGEAHELGLVNAVAPSEDLEQLVLEVATDFASKPRSALVATKRTLAVAGSGLTEYLAEEQRQFHRCVRGLAVVRPGSGR